MTIGGYNGSRIPILAAVTLAASSVGMFISSSAEATTASYQNPTTCSSSVQNGVCISSVTDDYETSTVTLGMTVGKATDPTSDPNWLTSGFDTNVTWGISTTSSTAPAYIAEADSNLNTPGTFSGVVYSATSSHTTPLCNASSGVVVSIDLAANSYGISFPSSCISSPASLGIQASYAYSTSAGSVGEVAAA